MTRSTILQACKTQPEGAPSRYSPIRRWRPIPNIGSHSGARPMCSQANSRATDLSTNGRNGREPESTWEITATRTKRRTRDGQGHSLGEPSISRRLRCNIRYREERQDEIVVATESGICHVSEGANDEGRNVTVESNDEHDIVQQKTKTPHTKRESKGRRTGAFKSEGASCSKRRGRRSTDTHRCNRNGRPHDG
ncbi:hypothetical protein MHU86_5517 [Fragilaria crotonensis]|nr:hypothetical protein MHU86_5517 [Fragilaria crotonensis]